MLRVTSTAVVVGALALGLGCGASTTAPPLAARLSVTATPAGIESGRNRLVRVIVRNDGGGDAALSGCPRAPSVMIERREGLAWRDAGSSGVRCLAIYTTQTVTLAAGDRVEAVITAGPAGRYRFAVPVGADGAHPQFVLRSRAVDLR